MKKTRKINLLVNKTDYGKIDRYFKYLRRGVLILTILLFIFVVSFLYLHFNQTLRLQSLIKEQQNSLNILNEQRDNEVKLIYAANKVKTLDKFLLEDANFYPYYNLLVGNLSAGTESGQLSSLTIDKDRESEFILVFSSFDKMLSSFKLIESPEFLKNFETLSLTDFLSGSNNQNFQLTFEGKFKKIR